MAEHRVLFKCRDRKAVHESLNHVMTFLGYNLTSNKGEGKDGFYFVRMQGLLIDGNKGNPSLKELQANLDNTLAIEGFEDVFLRVTDANALKKAVVFVTKQTHCLEDILREGREGSSQIDVKLVVGNYDDFNINDRSTPKKVAEMYGLKYAYVDFGKPSGDSFALPTSKEKEAQMKILSMPEVANADIVCLAKFMRKISNEFASKFPGKIINVHHGSFEFPGQNPYKQAYDRGVKSIMSTAHYISCSDPGIDSGTIIDQEEVRVGNDSFEEFARKGRASERKVFSEAIRLESQDRIIEYKVPGAKNSKAFIFY